MIGKDQKKEDLEQLEKFIRKPKICGFNSNFWYHMLRSKYPYQFIQLMKRCRNTQKHPNSISYDDRYIQEAEEKIRKLNRKFIMHILKPASQIDQKEWDYILATLDDFILRQIREN